MDFFPTVGTGGSSLGALCRALDGDGGVFKRSSVASAEISQFLSLALKTDTSNLVTSAA